ncbi:MAG: pyridoxamine 5'-phosphate oxidase family protein [Actinobacteria bacterium]|nr:pyridoxamine 5'-phosphate oxidase family protein [Actinomycetota bacterium]
MSPSPRSPEQRKRDTLHRLEHDVDPWVATGGDADRTPYLVPLSFLWDGASLLIATPSSSPTSRNLRSNATVRVGIGPTRDVVLIEGTAHASEASEITDEIGDAFGAKTGFDPRELTTSYVYFRIVPRQIQAWREADELDGRDLMRDGHWLV